MKRWLAREWGYVVVVVALVVAVAGLVIIGADPAMQQVSTILSVLIGGLSASLLQAIGQARERAARREESMLEARRRLVLERQSSARKHLIECVSGATLISRQVALAVGSYQRFSNSESGPRLLTEQLRKIYDTLEGGLGSVEGSAILATAQDRRVTELFGKFDNEYRDFIGYMGSKVTTTAVDVDVDQYINESAKKESQLTVTLGKLLQLLDDQAVDLDTR